MDWNALPGRYGTILCDIWGVVHDGIRLLPGAAARLRAWRTQGRFVLLVTNAARTAPVVERELQAMGLAPDCWDAVLTAGDVGIAALANLDRPVGFLGTPEDRVVLEEHGVMIASSDAFGELACSGLEDDRPELEDYSSDLKRWRDQGVRLHCLNPDRVVMVGASEELCAGAIADRYEALGGKVAWYGKPFPDVYRQALHLAGNPAPSSVLAVGDGLRTDMLGAARAGLDAVFVRGGIHKREPFPSDFATANGLGHWRPIATVDGLA